MVERADMGKTHCARWIRSRQRGRAEVLPVANRLARRADQEALMLRSKKQTAVAALHSWRHSLVQKGMSSIDAATFKPANASGRHLFSNSIAQDGSGQR